MTALASELRKANLVNDHDRLRKMAVDIFAKAGATHLAVQRLCKELMKDRALLEAMAEEYLKSLPEGGHSMLDGHSAPAPDRQSQNGKGHQKLDTHAHNAQADSKGAGQSVFEAHRHNARPRTAPIPLSKRTAATMASAQETARKEWHLATYRIPDGPLVMQTSIGNLPGIRSRMLTKGGHYLHGAVVVRALEEATAKYAAANPYATARDVLSAKEITLLEEMISPDKVQRDAAAWMRKFPELEKLHG